MKLKILVPLFVAGFTFSQQTKAQKLLSDSTNFQHTKIITTFRDSAALKKTTNTANDFHADSKAIITPSSDKQLISDNPTVQEIYDYFLHYRRNPSGEPPLGFNCYRSYYA